MFYLVYVKETSKQNCLLMYTKVAMNNGDG